MGNDEFQYERQLKHGPWLEARGVPVQGGSRLTIYRDITERRAAEQALRDANSALELRVEERTAALAESERFYRATLDSIDTRLAVFDGDGRIIATNGAWQRFADASSAAWHTAGDQADYLVACAQTVGPGAEEARLAAASIREILIGNRQSFEVEYASPTVEGERYFLCRVARVGAERPVRVVVTHDDVTVVRQAEQQARRAQRMEAIGTLAGGIAHDLNNALTPVVMGLDLLSAEFPDHAGTIEMMAASARHGAEMLKQLLTFARGAEGRRLAVQPAAFIEDVERIARGTFPKGISLESRVRPSLPVVRGDPTQLHQVLLNLCLNARDAMPNGGTLTLAAEVVTVDEGLARTTAGARPGTFVRLSVQDTGTGIEAADLDRIFDPFFTTKRLDQGTGLGLSTAMGIVKHSLKEPIVFTGSSAMWTGWYSKIFLKIIRRLCAYHEIESIHDPKVKEIVRRVAQIDAEVTPLQRGKETVKRGAQADAAAALLHATALATADLDFPNLVKAKIRYMIDEACLVGYRWGRAEADMRMKPLAEAGYRSRTASPSGGRISGERRRQKAEQTWKPLALRLANEIRKKIQHYRTRPSLE